MAMATNDKSEGSRAMKAQGKTVRQLRWRLAANDNETILVDGAVSSAWRLAGNDNETIVTDEDTEGHRLAGNDNETIVPGVRTRVVGDDDGDGADDPEPDSMRR